ncbi:hypothetical protein R1sor_013063 [Riccia sorocarpa]|uniref:Complex I-B14.7 n=1 Tax=Riccia sorocarpa TaxID=122646 RepID=A0ABD3H9D2_9MARC
MDAEEVRDLGEYDTVVFRTASGAGSSFIAGTILGAIQATWTDAPVEKNQAWRALQKTGHIMGSYGILFAAIGGTFTFVDAVSETIRGKKDFVNGVIGGFAAGSILGVKAGRVPVGLGAGAAMAAVSAFMDAGGQRTRAPTGREYLPYPRENRIDT